MTHYEKAATKADVEDFTAWLKVKSKKDASFYINNSTNCPIAQYLRDRGYKNQVVCITLQTAYLGANSYALPSQIRNIVYGTGFPPIIPSTNTSTPASVLYDRAKVVLASMLY